MTQFHGFPDFQPSLDVADLIVNQQGVSLPNASGITLGTFDMRRYSSYGVELEVVTNALATAYNGIEIGIAWYLDSGTTKILYEDVNGIFARDVGAGAFFNDAGRFEIQDNVHGPYMILVAFNLGPDNCTVDFNLMGTSRTLNRRYTRNPSSSGGFGIDLLDSKLLVVNGGVVGVGANQNRIVRYAPGPCWLSMTVAAAPGAFRFFDVEGIDVGGFFANIAGQTQAMIQLPKSAIRVNVANGGGVPMTYSIVMVTGRDSM